MLSPISSDLFLAFVRPFQAENKIMRLFNAHRSSWIGCAMEPVLKNGLPAFPTKRTEAACYAMSRRSCSIFKNPGVSSQCARSEVHPILEMLSQHLGATTIRQIAKHLVLSTRPAFQSNLFAEIASARLWILTPNAPMSGAEARSAEASAPLAG